MDKSQLGFVNREGKTIRYEKAADYERTECHKEYRLVITAYKAKGYFGKRKAVLYRGEKEIAEFWRNYADFPYVFVEHANGNLYFICSEEYHGQVTIYNITKDERRCIHPSDGMEEKPKYGSWFMWIEIDYDPDEQELNVYGGYWGLESKFGTRTFDFSRPDEVPYDNEWWKGIRTTEGAEAPESEAGDD